VNQSEFRIHLVVEEMAGAPVDFIE